MKREEEKENDETRVGDCVVMENEAKGGKGEGFFIDGSSYFSSSLLSFLFSNISLSQNEVYKGNDFFTLFFC
jgi:hypothetical protein